MSEFYDIDSTRVSLREYWWGTRSPLILIALILKWLRVRIPSSSDDPNVDSTTPFVVESLPPEIEAAFQPLLGELAGLGFVDPVYHLIYDPGIRTRIYWATLRHNSGRYMARVHHRVWQQAQKANRGLYPMFFTAFADGTFLVSSAGKPDMAAPESVRVQYLRGAKAERLFAAHEQLTSATTERKMIAPVSSREDLLAMSERHHVLMRDFHLARGVFKARSSADQEKAEAFAASVAQAQAGGQENAEVLAELERMQDKKPGWRNTWWVLIGSLALFLAIGAASWDWKFTLWILPVLLFHEGGHWVAMRLFRYRNVRMFFIPLFGAAVTGQNWNVPGWKKALVSLAGPLPGIALGVALGIAGLLLKHGWLINAALVLLLINGLNLLPILPLDGGHVFQDTLFCRNRWLDGTFRILAIAGLVLLGTFGGMPIMRYVAIATAIALPVVFRLGKVTDQLRRQGLPPPLPGEDRIPAPTAQAIVSVLRAAFPAKVSMSNKMLAQHTLTVFERLNARPPGWLATIALLGLHFGALTIAVVVSMLLVLGQQGGLRDFVTAAVRQPKHVFVPSEVRHCPPPATVANDAVRTRIVCTLRSRLAARNAFVELTNTLSTDSTLTLLGDSLVLSLPAADDRARERWFDTLQAHSTNTFVALSNAPVVASLNFLARDEVSATNITRELRSYLEIAGQMHLVAPWAPDADQPGFARWRQARLDWASIQRELSSTWRDPALKGYASKMAEALRRGSTADALRLEKEQEEKRKELQEKARERLRAGIPVRVNPELVDLEARLNDSSLTNRAERKAVLRQVAAQLGEVQYAGAEPAPGALRWSTGSGSVLRHGLLVELRWVNFYDVSRGLPTLAQWLYDQGCREFKYDFHRAGWPGLMEEDDD